MKIFKTLWLTAVLTGCFLAIMVSVVSSVNKIEGYMIGVADTVPEKVNGLGNYEAKMTQSMRNINKMSWEEYRQQRKEELEFEVELIQTVRSIYNTLQEKNMIGR